MTARAAAESVLPSSKSMYHASKTKEAFQSAASGKTVVVVIVVDVAVDDDIVLAAVELLALRRFVIVGVVVADVDAKSLYPLSIP